MTESSPSAVPANETPGDGTVEQAPDQRVDQPVEPSAAELVTSAEPIESGEPVESPDDQQPPAPLAAAEPSVAATLNVAASSAPLAAQADPAADGPNSGDGGEWELLLQKVREWLNQGQLQSLWAQARKPVTLVAYLLGLLLILRIYGALLGALDSLPLVPGLLELAGVVWMVRFGVPKLLRTSEREAMLGGLSKRWKAFRGTA
jgi:hypothetical protein